MKRLGLLTAVFTLAVMLYSVPAMAVPSLLADAYNEFKIENVENWVDMQAVGDAGYGQISAGDLFYGIMSIQNINSDNGLQWSQDVDDQLSGYFLTEVHTIGLELGAYHIQMKASTVDVSSLAGLGLADVITAGERASGVVIKLFTDSATGFTRKSGSINSDISNATDGSLWGSLTIDNGYWYSHSPTNIPGALDNDSVIDSWSGLDFLVNNTGYEFTKIDDTSENETVTNTFVDMYADSKIQLNQNPLVASYWKYTSDDPAMVYVTPEPSTFILLGSGLIGAALIRRKRKMKKG